LLDLDQANGRDRCDDELCDAHPRLDDERNLTIRVDQYDPDLSPIARIDEGSLAAACRAAPRTERNRTTSCMHLNVQRDCFGVALRRTTTLGIRVDSLALADLRRLIETAARSSGPVLFTFANPASVILAERDRAYRDLLEKFDIVLPDGIGLCWAIRRLHGFHAARVSFDTTSLAPLVFEFARQEKMSLALVGGRPGVADWRRALLQSFR